MVNIFVHAHSGFRWLVLLFLIVAVVNAMMKKNRYSNSDRILNLVTMIVFHIQFLIGIVLYFISPMVTHASGWMSNNISRFYGMEHEIPMVLAMILITVGHAKSKKATDASKKNKAIFTYYFISLILILAAIPWPFRNLGASLF